MSYYSDDPRSVRVDFWKLTGKWYTTEAVMWTGDYKGTSQLIHDAFKQSLRDHFGNERRLSGMQATCLEPYHEYAHPISVLVDSIWAGKK